MLSGFSPGMKKGLRRGREWIKDQTENWKENLSCEGILGYQTHTPRKEKPESTEHQSICGDEEKPSEPYTFAPHFVIEVVGAEGLSRRGCFIAVRAADRAGKLKGRRVNTLVQRNTNSPRCHSFRDLRFRAARGDLLLFEVYNQGWDDLIAQGHLGVEMLPADMTEITVPLHHNLLTNHPAGCGGGGAVNPSGSVVVRRVQWCADEHAGLKRLFLIRHGQSLWNEGQENLNLNKMVGFDHPLTSQGTQQAKVFCFKWEQEAHNRHKRRRIESTHGEESEEPDEDYEEWLDAFLNTDEVYSSPLTRALSTALLCLDGHPTVSSRGITLLRSAREIKALGSLDTVGRCCGERSLERAVQKLRETLGSRQEADKFTDTQIHVNDTACDWWTAPDDVDRESDLSSRMDDFLQTLRFNPGESLIVVGHSLFFKDLMRRFLGSGFRQQRPDLAKEVTEKKLENAACLGLQVDFGQDPPIIVDVKPMFGAQFV